MKKIINIICLVCLLNTSFLEANIQNSNDDFKELQRKADSLHLEVLNTSFDGRIKTASEDVIGKRRKVEQFTGEKWFIKDGEDELNRAYEEVMKNEAKKTQEDNNQMLIYSLIGIAILIVIIILVRKGKQTIEPKLTEIKKEKSFDKSLENLKKLNDLKNSGAITEEEYSKMKNDIMNLK